MSALANLNHERFCQAVHARMASGERLISAQAEAYVDTVYEGDRTDRKAAVKGCAANGRRLYQRKEVAARIKELAAYAAQLAGIDAGWALIQAKKLFECNLHDYLSAPDEHGRRFYDISKVEPEKLALLAELSIDQWEKALVNDGGDTDLIVRGIKVKLKPHDKIGILSLMARIAGWEAPKKIAPTDAEGKTLTLEQLVGASMLVRPAEPKAEAA